MDSSVSEISVERASARFSLCGKFRYLLTREFGADSTCLFVMLNPSTADATQDDPTIRRCISFAKREGFGRLEVVNLYAFRSASPTVLFAAEDPIGDDNDDEIRLVLGRADVVITAWGNHGDFDPRRIKIVRGLIEASGKPVRHFGSTALGQPKHPLYLRGDAELIPFADN